MGDKTGIEWTDATWNPTVGCSVVSPGCTNCYAMKMAHRIGPNFPHYRGLTKLTKGGPVWTGRVAAAPESTLLQPLRWKRPRRIFVNSMSDVFHEAVADETIDCIFAVMALTPQHTYQVLTKRAERMRDYVSQRPQVIWDRRALEIDPSALGRLKALPWPLPNAWLGVSAERQEEADQRIPDLLRTPAAKRFLSCEPLLGPLDVAWALSRNRLDIAGGFLARGSFSPGLETLRPVDWIIAGGESGLKARAAHPDWFRALRDQCQAAGVPFFFKQWGEWAPPVDGQRYDTSKGRAGKPPAFIVSHDGTVHCFDGEHVTRGSAMVRVGKSVAGGALDGLEHRAFPA